MIFGRNGKFNVCCLSVLKLNCYLDISVFNFADSFNDIGLFTVKGICLFSNVNKCLQECAKTEIKGICINALIKAKLFFKPLLIAEIFLLEKLYKVVSLFGLYVFLKSKSLDSSLP